ncbi:MAG: flagellar basal body-associated FliL family protein [Xanthomonadales bacterium]|jgi:flagellar FliL protein|nr:flagellar basal body-associated FliL family protein [Xanthomonadales bacterium]
MAAKPAPAAAAAAPAEAKKGKPIVLILIVLIVGLAAGGGGAYFMVGGKAKTADAEHSDSHDEDADDDDHGDTPSKPAQYLALEPAFVVNLADEGGTRYLQAEVQVMTRKPAVLENVKTHTPAIRNALLMLFAQKTQADLRNKEGREQLQVAALEEVNRVLKEETGKGGVEAIFFMSFVTQ